MNEAGVIGCFHDALDTRINPQSVIDLVEEHNELLLGAKSEREAYQAALSVPYPNGEPEVVEVLNEEGQTVQIENPLYTAWNEARGAIGNTSPEVLAWIEADQPRPEDDDEDALDGWLASVALRDMTYRDTAPDFEPITDSPLLVPLKRWAFDTVIDLTPGLRDQIENAIANGPFTDAQKIAAKNRFETTTDYYSWNPLFKALRPLVGLEDDAVYAALWAQAVQIQNS